MLLEFIDQNRTALINDARARVSQRRAPRTGDSEQEQGVPLFLQQFSTILRDSSTDGAALSASATRHGADMLEAGFTIAQVVHGYGDICQSITELAFAVDAPLSTDEFRTLNRCLDEAIAAAVTEFLRLREERIAAADLERSGALAHEQRNFLSAALTAFQVLREGKVAIGGSTGAVLGRALLGLREGLDRSISEFRLAAGVEHHARIDVAEFVEDVEATAMLEANARNILFTVERPPAGAAMDSDRLLLMSAISNLLSNAFKFSVSRGRVTLRALVVADQVRLEVEDECGGLGPEGVDAMSRTYDRRRQDRTGLGLGLTIARQGIVSSGGTLEIKDLPGKGCVFSVVLRAAR